MAISFDSIAQDCVTAYSTGKIAANAPCKFASSGMISSCNDGNAFHGIVLKQSENRVTVAIKGFVTVPYSSSVPTVGYCPLAAAGNGKVKKLDGAKEYLVVSVDTSKSTVTFLL